MPANQVFTGLGVRQHVVEKRALLPVLQVSGDVGANAFEVDGGDLLDQPLQQPRLGHDQDDPELAEYAVGIDWKKTFAISEAKTFTGAFSNQNVVCRLRDPATIDFLKQVFEFKREEI